MLKVNALTLIFAALSGLFGVSFAQNNSSILINPFTRFSSLNLSLPEGAEFPVLQSTFETPPDCGETSYVGRGRLRGRRALVTGGDSGIGRAITIAYAREGASVAINYLPEEESDAQDFLAAEDLHIERIPGDLLNETFCTELVHEAHDRLGGLDILVNHAGYSGIIQGPNARSISNASTEQFDRVFRTNVYASFYTTRAAVPLLPPGSSLIYTASNVARLPLPNGVDYSASKAAIVSMVRSLAVQLAPQGIRSNAVAPGRVYTPFLAASGYTTEDVLDNASHPQRRIEQPVELSPVYVDLAVAENSYVTGAIWGATGGLFGF